MSDGLKEIGVDKDQIYLVGVFFVFLIVINFMIVHSFADQCSTDDVMTDSLKFTLFGKGFLNFMWNSMTLVYRTPPIFRLELLTYLLLLYELSFANSSIHGLISITPL